MTVRVYAMERLTVLVGWSGAMGGCYGVCVWLRGALTTVGGCVRVVGVG